MRWVEERAVETRTTTPANESWDRPWSLSARTRRRRLTGEALPCSFTEECDGMISISIEDSNRSKIGRSKRLARVRPVYISSAGKETINLRNRNSRVCPARPRCRAGQEEREVREDDERGIVVVGEK